MHLAADGRCRPLAFFPTAGQAGDAPAFTDVMSRLRVTRPFGRPRTRPDLVLDGEACSSRAIRDHPRRRGIRAVITERADQQANQRQRGQTDGRPPAFDREAYKQRNIVERCVNRLKQWRGIATRQSRRDKLTADQVAVAVDTVLRCGSDLTLLTWRRRELVARPPAPVRAGRSCRWRYSTSM